MPSIVAVMVAGIGVLLLATVGISDAVGVAVNVCVTVGLGQPIGMPHGVADGISRRAGGLVLL